MKFSTSFIHFITSTILSLLILISPILSLYQHSKVKELTSANFDKVVLKNEFPVLVEFYAPYCGHCKNLVPVYSKLAENMNGLMDIASIDCTIPTNQPICSRYRIEGYPTIKFFYYDSNAKRKLVIDYNGERSTVAMANYLKLHVPSFIFKITSKDLSPNKADKWTVNPDTFFSKGKTLPKVILFNTTTTQKPSLLYRIMSILFHYKIVFGQVSVKDEADFSAKYNIKINGKNENVLIFFPTGSSEEHIVYSDEISRVKLRAYLEEQLTLVEKKKKNIAENNEL